MKFSVIAAVLAIASTVSAAEFGFTSPKENAVYHTGDTVKFAWHDYTSKNESITLVLANQGKAHHWHPYKDIVQLHKPFPTSYDWHIPKGIAKQRYFLVITDDTGSQPFSPYFYVK
ncbi:hypothetical protein INT43_001267 [Umbelopsis isabellina]|uniref:Yeast cell wall synthesis Kre9/Knh1-like N-terminal domain-containing protein n=1 Tax=Mortierella isabellina TaxID=91625 RepID=A0A8H7PKZ3_MORIS|nr:hypothetical protein INT43_001267 [Umbelopsis isabellina]